MRLDKKKVVFILSMIHSGSTLLGNILGTHSKGFHSGEIVYPIISNELYRCKFCAQGKCEIWDKILSKNEVEENVQLFQKEQSWLFSFKTALGIKKKESELKNGYLFNKIFDKLDGVEFVVDGSKDVDWAFWNAKVNSFDAKFIFLSRNPLGVCASILRRGGKSFEQVVNEMKAYKIRLENAEKGIDKQKIVNVEYEDLVNRKSVIIKKICKFLEIEFEESMLQNFNANQHVIGGNGYTQVILRKNNENLVSKINEVIAVNDNVKNRALKAKIEFYNDFGISEIRSDNRWKKELSEDQKEIMRKEFFFNKSD